MRNETRHLLELAFRGFDPLPEHALVEKLLERARRLDPTSPYILDSLGWARYRQGRYRNSRVYL